MLTDKNIVSIREKSYGFHNFQEKFVNQNRIFLKNLISKNHIYYSMFNRNKIKVSYNCMQNIKSVINNQNMKVLNNTAEAKGSCNLETGATVT